MDDQKSIPGEMAPDLEAGLQKPQKASGIKGGLTRVMDVLVEYGVEERGIVPRPVEVGALPTLKIHPLGGIQHQHPHQGVIGPSLFLLPFRTCVGCIVGFTALSCLPVAYLATNGPKTGMRQMVQARFALGFFPALLVGLLNCVTFVGFLALTSILGGQSLSLASSNSMSWTVGIIVVAIIGLIISFLGLRALHIFSLSSFPIILIVFIVVVGVSGDKFHLAVSDEAIALTEVTASAVLGYGSSLIGFCISYTSLASDFTTSLPPTTPRLPLFCVVYAGLFVPIATIQIIGAAAQSAAFAVPAWNDASLLGVPNLLFTMIGGGGPAKFVMVLFCFSVIANIAPTIYSCGLSGQVAIPWLVRVPRYFLAVIVSAIYLPIAIVGADHFYTALENFLYFLAYYTAIYVPMVLIEPIIFRSPVSWTTYPLDVWDQPKKLPIGIAAIVSAICGIPLIAAGMSQTWWTGWIARRVAGGYGDVGFEMTFLGVAVLFLPLRYLERKYTGR
ncbi:hypothetical protein P7C73_g2292, partial [Tremellales sp. Uapishka_1]